MGGHGLRELHFEFGKQGGKVQKPLHAGSEFFHVAILGHGSAARCQLQAPSMAGIVEFGLALLL
jgi:hypothetical protein